MKKFYFLVYFCLFILGYGQSVQLHNPDNNSVYPNEQNFCTGEQFNLKVDAVASSTGDYGISKVTGFNIADRSIKVPFSNKVGNNHFSMPVPIGFNFSFYGIVYDKFVVGSNGRLVFTNSASGDILHTNAYTDRIHSGNSSSSSNIPLAMFNTTYNRIYTADATTELPLAQIFAGFTDLGYLNTSEYDKITYGTAQYNGVDGLLISFKDILQSTAGTGYDKTIKIQILLLKTNEIIINVLKNNFDKNAILGIQNENASKFKVPQHSSPLTSNYNNGEWKSEGIAWLFKPNQNLTPVFKWTNNGNPVGTNSDTLNNFAPTNNDVLKVEVTYLEDTSIIKTDEVLFKTIQTPVITTISSTCAQINLETALVPDVTYEWRKVGTSTVLSTTNKLSVTASGDYYVKIIRNNSAGVCNLDSVPVALSLNANFPAFNNSPKFICKTDGSTVTSVNLYDYYPADPTQYNLKFQENGVDISTPSAFAITENTKRTIKIIAESLTSTAPCTFTDTFNITFYSLPTNDREFQSSSICFGAVTYYVSDFENQFAGKNYEFRYSIDGGVTYQTSSQINPQTSNQVLVKIKHPNVACESVVKLNINFYPEIEIKQFSPFPEHCASSSEYFDLNLTKSELEYAADIRATFYTDAGLTDQITNLNYRGSGIVYIKVSNIATNCSAKTVAQLNLKVYSKPTLQKTTAEVKYSQCGTTLFNLTTNINDYIGNFNHYAEIRYYDFSGTLLTEQEYENYDFTVRQQPYMIFVYNETNNLQCSDRINFDLIELKKPAALSSSILICAETNYTLQSFKDKVIANSADYTFTDMSGKPLPANFSLAILPLTVDFFIKNNATGCLSDQQTVTFVKGGNTALSISEIDYILCDADFDGKTEFNLDSKKSDFTNDSSANFEYFKDANLTQSIGSNYTNETPFAQTIFVRITIQNFCPSIAKINLKVNIPEKSSTLTDKYFICFNETLSIDAGAENDTVIWSDGQTGQFAQFTKAGNYSVVLKNGPDGCPYTHTFTISDENQPKIQVINQTNNSIEVIASGGSQPYTYYFNGAPQLSNVLQNPTASSYKIQVESATGCMGPPKTVYFIKINNAFTPNADGINDIWKIQNLDKMEQVSIVVVDRIGTKVFESTNPNKTEWDGKQNGRGLPTSTYWYVVSWYDAITQKNEQRQGWVLMKNRN